MIERDARGRPVGPPPEWWRASLAWREEMAQREFETRVRRAYQSAGRRCVCDGPWIRYRLVRCGRCPLRGVITSPDDVP